jgi:hypothetical protein
VRLPPITSNEILFLIVFFEAMKKTDFAEPIPAGQMKQKSDLKMKAGRSRKCLKDGWPSFVINQRTEMNHINQ